MSGAHLRAADQCLLIPGIFALLNARTLSALWGGVCLENGTYSQQIWIFRVSPGFCTVIPILDRSGQHEGLSRQAKTCKCPNPNQIWLPRGDRLGKVHSMKNLYQDKYPMLWELLLFKDSELRATYTVNDVARIFNVESRTIQNWVASGKLKSRNLPGRAKFMSTDLEACLVNSVSPGYTKRTGRVHGR